MGYKVMQIEVSNLCSLTCAYCPHPTQARPKDNMSLGTFEKCLELVQRSDNPVYKGRKFVWLNHFGEPLLNPRLADFIALAASRDIEVSFATNGVDEDKRLFPRERWRELAAAGLKGVAFSAHVKSARRFKAQVDGIVEVISVWEPRRDQIHDWAGQVELKAQWSHEHDGARRQPCDYQRDNMFAVTWDGRIAACCYDIEGQPGLTVDDVLANGFGFRDVPLCATCNLGRGDADWLREPLHQILGPAQPWYRRWLGGRQAQSA
jgi:organic radical activating enzyme